MGFFMEKRNCMKKKIIYLMPVLISACATHTPAPKPEGKLFPINPNQEKVTESYVEPVNEQAYKPTFDLVTKSIDVKTKENIIKDKPTIYPKPTLRKKVEVVTEHKTKDEGNKEVIKEIETTITTKQVVERTELKPTVPLPSTQIKPLTKPNPEAVVETKVKSNKESDKLFELKK